MGGLEALELGEPGTFMQKENGQKLKATGVGKDLLC